jgi:hypothetical protein
LKNDTETPQGQFTVPGVFFDAQKPDKTKEKGRRYQYSQKACMVFWFFVYKTRCPPLAFSCKKDYNNRTIGMIVSISLRTISEPGVDTPK